VTFPPGPPPSDGDHPSLEERVARLEETLAMVAAELAALRGTGAPSRSTAARPLIPPPPPFTAAPATRRFRSDDVESLLGRYGMLVIAVLAAVAAVGTFLSWAIAHRYLQLGPTARLVLGLVVAAAIGGWGFRLRRRERSFGSTLLGLSLAIVHVCAYGAGPGLHIVPSAAAFVGAAVVSWMLAYFAHTENDEPLWCAAFAGAAIAPFVTSDGVANEYALLGYGILVLIPGCFAIGKRDWAIGWRAVYAVSALYAIAAATVAERSGMPEFVTAFSFPFVVATFGVAIVAPATRVRGVLRWMALLALIASLGNGPATASETLAGVIIGGLAMWLLLLDYHADAPQSTVIRRTRNDPVVLDWFDAAVLPFAFAIRAADAVMFEHGLWPAFAAATVLALIFTWRRRVGSLRDASAFATSATAIMAVLVAPIEKPLGRIAACVALSLLLLALHKPRPSRTWVVVGGVFLIGTALRTVVLLMFRRPYQFTPFTTEPSTCALAVLIGFIAISRFWPLLRTATRESLAGRAEWTYAAELRLLLRAVTTAPWLWAFVWALIELAMAYSPSTAALLLVVYFAATAVASVAIGRARHRARLRQTGLGLALAAAATACYGASTYFDFGARIAAYLVTSVFLLGIAYWYRRPGGTTAAAT